MLKNEASAFLIRKALEKKSVSIIKAETKEEALDFMVDLISNSDKVENKEALREGVRYRETLMSTGIGLGIAVPHVRNDSIKDLVMAAGICEKPLTDYQALDDEPVRIIFMIAAHTGQHSEHIKLLAALSQKCKEEDFRNRLFNARSENELYHILTGKEDE